MSVTNLQLQAGIKREYGLQLHPSREIVKAVSRSGDTAMIVTLKMRVALGSRDDRVTHQGMRTVHLAYNGSSWAVSADDTLWIELPQPVILARFMVKNTPERVAADNLAWNLCNQPGAADWVGGSAWRTADMDSRDRRAQLMTWGY